jgi:hypothetical protein
MESLTQTRLSGKVKPIPDPTRERIDQPKPVNPLTQLTQLEVGGKANPARDKDYALLWLNPAYPSRNPANPTITRSPTRRRILP